MGMPISIPRVYIAKRISERMTGVGRTTDLVVLSYREEIKNYAPALFPTEFITDLDNAVEDIRKSESDKLVDLGKKLMEKYWKKPAIDDTSNAGDKDKKN
jgi:hypothetical protein